MAIPRYLSDQQSLSHQQGMNNAYSDWQARQMQNLQPLRPSTANNDGRAVEVQPGHRTQEQIIAQCEARYAALEKEAEAKREADRLAVERDKVACRKCRWVKGYDRNYPNLAQCTQPLVKGFDLTDVYTYDSGYRDSRVSLCGPEKALWEPKPALWERVINFICK